MIELLINGRPASELGLYMGENFLNTIDGLEEYKPFVSSSSRLLDGKIINPTNPKVESRELSLPFFLFGKTPDEFRLRKYELQNILKKIRVEIGVPCLHTTYKLCYTGKQTSYSLNLRRNICKFTIKFEEPNPADRGTC